MFGFTHAFSSFLASHRTQSIQICLGLSHPLQREKSAQLLTVMLLLLLTIHNRRRKPFDSPSAPMRAADYKLMTEFDAP